MTTTKTTTTAPASTVRVGDRLANLSGSVTGVAHNGVKVTFFTTFGTVVTREADEMVTFTR